VTLSGEAGFILDRENNREVLPAVISRG